MKLIMVERYLDTEAKRTLAELLNCTLAKWDYDGRSTKEIEERLKQECPNVAIVSADSRMMRFIKEDCFFQLDNVYVYRNGECKKLQDTTTRILRYSHHLMNLYESGEFEFA